MRTQVEIFVNRMKSDSSRGRSISTDSSVQTLFLNLTAFHSRLLGYIKEADDKRMWFEQLQDKLTQIKDSRAALDVLRQEHLEKMRRQAEEQERQRQMQMAYKLELMRKKKQEYLQYQRQLALQRIQEQEREMQIHQEQQKVMYSMGVQSYGPPGATFITSPPPTGGSPAHLINGPGGIGQVAGNFGSPQNLPVYSMPPQAMGPPSLGPQSMGPQSLGPQSLGPQSLGHYAVGGQQPSAVYSMPPTQQQQQPQQHPSQPIGMPGQYSAGIPGNPSPVHLTQGMHQPPVHHGTQMPPPHAQAEYMAAAAGPPPNTQIQQHLPQTNPALAHAAASYPPAGVPPQPQQISNGQMGGVPQAQPPAPTAAAITSTAVPDPPKETIPHVAEAELISFD